MVLFGVFPDKSRIPQKGNGFRRVELFFMALDQSVPHKIGIGFSSAGFEAGETVKDLLGAHQGIRSLAQIDTVAGPRPISG
jgi:hypothetical protein